MPKLVDMSKHRVGRWTVLSRDPTPSPNAMWLARCDCGVTKRVSGNALRVGKSQSCGCLMREVAKRRGMESRDRLSVPFATTVFRNVLKHYKENATKRGLPWNLSARQFGRLTAAACFYCGAMPKQYKSKYGKHVTSCGGVDRLDSAKGYAIKNCVPCCKQCNFAKQGVEHAEFLLWIRRVYEHTRAQPS